MRRASVATAVRIVSALAIGGLMVSAFSTVAQAQTPTTFQPPPGTVTMTLAEYNRLLDRGAATPALRNDPPVPAVISRAEIDLRVNAGSTGGGSVGVGAARAAITLQGEVFRTGPTDVPLLSGGTLIEAQLAGRAVPMVFASGGYRAILPGNASGQGAPFSLALTWGTPVLSEPGRAVLILPAVSAGSVRATIDLPGDLGDVRLQPGAITARSVNAGRTRLEVTLDPGTATRVSWSSRETSETATRRAVRLLSDVKALVTMGEADVRIAALFDITVVQGEPSRFDVRLPAGYELTSASGASIEEFTTKDGVTTLTVREPARRRHQFLIALERAGGAPTGFGATAAVASVDSNAGAGAASSGSASTSTSTAAATGTGTTATAAPASARQVPLPWLDGVQRETGEVAIEGVGTLELEAAEKNPLHRIDASELSATTLSLVRESVLAAFRYQRRTPDAVMLDLDVKRFPESPVLAAIAERAVVTTMVMHQGRALTEMTLTVSNQGQPFMKVGLPQGATLLSAEVAGVSVKPVVGTDGARVPLLRTGFRPSGRYTVSFVYLQSGAAYGKKGDAQMSLAKLDLPINLLEWELFLPEGVRVKRFDGDVLPKNLVAMTLDMDPSARGALTEAVTVSEVPSPMVAQDRVRETVDGKQAASPPPPPASAFRAEVAPVEQNAQAPSVNVQNLQRRIAGVLPVRIDVPRAGTSYMFVRPIVIDEETTVRFAYRARS